MASTISVPSTLYEPQIVERALDSFHPNTTALRATFTRENWPGVPEDDVITVIATWSDGSGGRWTLPGGVVLAKDGQPLAASVVMVGVPEVADGAGRTKRKSVVGGVFAVQFHQALRTAVTLEAVF
jgi:hypothetical protein